MNGPRLSTVTLSGCTGCHVSLLDAHEELLALLGTIELAHSPFCGDERIPASDVILVEGAVATELDERRAREARAAAAVLVAIGACAVHGGIGGLRNLVRTDELLEAVYPGGPPSEAPALSPLVRPLSDVVEVDLEIPGCSPETATLVRAVRAAIAGGELDLPRRNLCAECERIHESMLSPSSDFVSDSVYALMELDHIDGARCFLEQGVICMGPMTTSGCGARCCDANVPCRGCTGPSRREFEQGAKTIDTLAAVLPAGAMMLMDDIVGTGYRFTTAVSVIPGIRDGGGDDD